ncbi:hypothetical protein [Pseudomonas nunensis]|uniref:hypothetical protein n=1 Tax=Pseudomonas nunensis TaxID=2961896 RepID=UPI003F66BDC5
MFNELTRLGEWQGENPVGTVRALKFDETEMAYLAAEQIPPLLADLDRRSPTAGAVARVCLATGARWSEAEGLSSRHMRDGRVHFARTKTSKNRTVPIFGRTAKADQKSDAFWHLLQEVWRVCRGFTN